jgi:hypothetical protein
MMALGFTSCDFAYLTQIYCISNIHSLQELWIWLLIPRRNLSFSAKLTIAKNTSLYAAMDFQA